MSDDSNKFYILAKPGHQGFVVVVAAVAVVVVLLLLSVLVVRNCFWLRSIPRKIPRI